jgi:hypothetical protein
MNGWCHAEREGYGRVDARDPEDLHTAILRAESHVVHPMPQHLGGWLSVPGHVVLAGARGQADTGSVPVFLLIVACLLPTAAGCALIWGGKGVRWLAERSYRRPAPEPIERLGADLRRLRSELEAVETRTDIAAKGHRLRALRGAYVDTLVTACQRLDVSPPPAGEHVPQAEIYRVEAALRQRGLEVRETATR